MTEIVAPDRGAFCFSELHTADVDGAKRFYGDLFGWTTVDVSSSGGSYLLFQRDGKDVAGLRRVADGAHRWVPHVYVENIDAIVARATSLGARLVAPPRETPGMARTCMIRDPEGAELGLWGAGGHQGARMIDVAGSLWWVELLAQDIDAARAFYSTLFEWTWLESSKIGFPYTVFKAADRQVAGGAQYEPDWGIASRWQVLFAVENFETAVKTAAAHGGTLAFWRDVPYNGRFGILNDAARAVFCIMDPNQVPATS